MTNSQASNNFFFSGTLTVKHLVTGVSDSIYFYHSHGSSSIGYPILKKFSINASVGNFLPQDISAEITFFNHENSLGYQRRLSDIFQEYTPIEQEIRIFTYQRANDRTFRTSSFKDFTVRSFSFSPDSNEIRLFLKAQPIKDQIVTKEVNLVDFPSCPTSSIGAYLPIGFGANCNLPCTPVSGGKYAYATNFGSDLKHGSITDFFVKDNKSIYRSVSNVATTNTVAFTNSWSSSIQGVLIGDEDNELGNRQSWAWELQQFTSNGTGYLCDRGRIFLKGTNLFPSEVPVGQFIIEIIEGDFPTTGSRRYVDEKDVHVLGRAIVEKIDYQTELETDAGFWLDFTFQETVIIGNPPDSTTTYYIRLIDTHTTQGIPCYYFQYNLSSGSIKLLRSTEQEALHYETTTSTTVPLQLYGLTATDSTSLVQDELGLGYHAFTIASGTAEHDINKFDFIVTANGLTEGAVLETSPPELIKTMLVRTTGNYLDSGLDNYWESSHASYPRNINGVLFGKKTLLEVISTLAYNGGCRIMPRTVADTKIGVDVFYWGSKLETSYVLTDKDIKILDYVTGARDEVVNIFKASYGKDILYTTPEELIRSGVKAGYKKQATQTIANNISVSLYGENSLAQDSFDLIASDTSIDYLADFYLGSFQHPSVSVSLVLPSSNRVFNIGQVIEILSASLPAFYGTAIKPDDIYTESGVQVTVEDAIDIIRAKRYRAMIESIKEELDESTGYLIYLTCKLLINPLDIT